MTVSMTLETLQAPVAQEINRLRATYQRRGWTLWHGKATGQYWAAHTGRMVMLSGDSAEGLAKEIEKVQPSRPPVTVPPPRNRSSWRLPARPRPRGTRPLR